MTGPCFIGTITLFAFAQLRIASLQFVGGKKEEREKKWADDPPALPEAARREHKII